MTAREKPMTMTTTIYHHNGPTLHTTPARSMREALESLAAAGADLRGANLTGANLARADLDGATLTGANLARADLRSAILDGADLRCAILAGADLRGADLTGADLGYAILDGASLTGAVLRRADLDGANLAGADLDYVTLTGATLTGATLDGAEGAPAIPDLDGRVLRIVEDDEVDGRLDMMSWHGHDGCETEHCRAGWYIALAGAQGARLEDEVGPAAAGALIFAASYPGEPIPDFYGDNETALADLRRLAGTRPVGQTVPATKDIDRTEGGE